MSRPDIVEFDPITVELRAVLGKMREVSNRHPVFDEKERIDRLHRLQRAKA